MKNRDARYRVLFKIRYFKEENFFHKINIALAYCLCLFISVGEDTNRWINTKSNATNQPRFAETPTQDGNSTQILYNLQFFSSSSAYTGLIIKTANSLCLLHTTRCSNFIAVGINHRINVNNKNSSTTCPNFHREAHYEKIFKLS